MKNKLTEKLIAILLVFAIAFLTIPLAKADIIISLEENEETEEVGSAVANAGQTRGTYYISYWYSQSISIGYWETPPTVHYCRMSGTAYFETAMENSTTRWRNALSISIGSSSAYNELDDLNYNGIQFYQGSNAQLSQLGFFEDSDISDNDTLGVTVMYDVPRYNAYPELVHTLILNGQNYNGYRYWCVRGFVKDFGSNTTKYNHVCTHEIGHALGWWGHSNNSADMMYTSYNGTTALTDRDKFHLKQYYDLFY